MTPPDQQTEMTPSPVPQRRRRADQGDRGRLRSLVTSHPSALSPTTAMRAREVARPTDEDLAEAARELVLVRRHYAPPTALPGGRQRKSPSRAGKRKKR